MGVLSKNNRHNFHYSQGDKERNEKPVRKEREQRGEKLLDGWGWGVRGVLLLVRREGRRVWKVGFLSCSS
ncbi:MAG: hypothetical protein MRERV_9c058 [Mycoplasmataceae bacterium RV_VA103A]|nr:MAG: hypothetical protein MRERV_9c058 [Mycoplasmataceae bacterium RV_VA103A]